MGAVGGGKDGFGIEADLVFDLESRVIILFDPIPIQTQRGGRGRGRSQRITRPEQQNAVGIGLLGVHVFP